MQFHLLFMQTVDYYHDRVLPAILIIQRAILVYNWRKQCKKYREHTRSQTPVAASEPSCTSG